jgi:hypothetical protein
VYTPDAKAPGVVSFALPLLPMFNDPLDTDAPVSVQSEASSKGLTYSRRISGFRRSHWDHKK